MPYCHAAAASAATTNLSTSTPYFLLSPTDSLAFFLAYQHARGHEELFTLTALALHEDSDGDALQDRVTQGSHRPVSSVIS
jgi:hypothetical protein